MMIEVQKPPESEFQQINFTAINNDLSKSNNDWKPRQTSYNTRNAAFANILGSQDLKHSVDRTQLKTS